MFLMIPEIRYIHLATDCHINQELHRLNMFAVPGLIPGLFQGSQTWTNWSELFQDLQVPWDLFLILVLISEQTPE